MRRTQTASGPLEWGRNGIRHDLCERFSLLAFTDPVAFSETFHSYGDITHNHTASAIVCSVRLNK